jgi:hypothetical protein
MKLLRLTTSEPDGSFDCFLNQEIDLKPKAQIALQSAIFETTERELTIDSNNNQVDFQTTDSGGVQTIRLDASTSTTYDSNNLQLLFDDMNNKINQSFSLTRPDQIGKQFRISDSSKTVNDGKVEAVFKTSAYTSTNDDLSKNINPTIVNGGATKTPSLAITGGNIIGSNSFDDNLTGEKKYNFFTHYSTPISKGAALFRMQIARFKLLTDAANKSVGGGFTICLAKGDPGAAAAPGFFTDNNMAARIQVMSQTAQETSVYSIKFGGDVEINSTTVVKDGLYAAQDTKNDYIEIAVDQNLTQNGRDLVCNVYRRNGANTEWDKIELGRKTYAANGETPDDLYAYAFIHGGTFAVGSTLVGQFNCRLMTPRFTADPFLLTQTPTSHLDAVPYVDDLSSSVKPSPPRNRNTNHSINFVDESLYEWLGYIRGQQNILQSSNGEAKFKADNLFGSKIVADAFLVQLLNLPVEAYDTLPSKQGRENILAVIPQDDEDLRVIYEANGLYFIELNNASPIKLSNIRARIVRQDYSIIQTRGLSSLVLFVNDTV